MHVDVQDVTCPVQHPSKDEKPCHQYSSLRTEARGTAGGEKVYEEQKALFEVICQAVDVSPEEWAFNLDSISRVGSCGDLTTALENKRQSVIKKILRSIRST